MAISETAFSQLQIYFEKQSWKIEREVSPQMRIYEASDLFDARRK